MGFIHVHKTSMIIIGRDKLTGEVKHQFDYESIGVFGSASKANDEIIPKLDKMYPGLQWEYEVFAID